MLNSTCFHDPPSPVLDVVFLHGISGDHDTWAPPGKYSWPDHLARTLPESRLLSLAFQSSRRRKVLGQKGTDAMVCAAEVLNQISALGVGRRPFILFGYSYGGLVAKAVLSKLMLAAQSESGARTVLQGLKAIFFFDTPHSGSAYAEGTRDHASDHVRDMASPGMLRLLDEALDKAGAAFGVKLVNVVRAARGSDWLPPVARSETEASGVVTVAVSKSHLDVHHLLGPDDAITTLLHGHLADVYRASLRRTGPSKNVVVHFLDHHYLKSVGVEQQQTGAETALGKRLNLLYRLAIVIGDSVILPASSVAESAACARLFAMYHQDAQNTFCASSHASFIDYLKSTEEAAKGIHDFVPTGFRHIEEIAALRMRQRARSATEDILKSMSSLDFEDLQRRIFAVLPNLERLRLMEQRWGDVHASSVRQFLVPLALANHVFDGAVDDALVRIISDVVNEAYFLSFLVEYDGVLFRDAFPGSFVKPVILPPDRCVDVFATTHRRGLAGQVTTIGDLSHEAFVEFAQSDQGAEFRRQYWSVDAQ